MESKICCRCKVEKDKQEFGNNKRNKDGKQKYCKECGRKSDKAHYRKNPKRKIAIATKNKEMIEENRQHVWNYLLSHPCVDCGESDPVVLEFDHVRGKKILPVAKMVIDSYSLQKIEEEIEKCDVRCANCHRRKTMSQLDWFRSRSSSIGRASVL